jgi:uncharacterized integral membrane protein
MRTIKLLVLVLLGLALVIVGVANMAPVDVHLLPPEIGAGAYVLRGVPLAGVILASVVVGVLVGQLLEYLREAKHRRRAEERRREVGRLKREVGRLAARLGESDDDLPEIPAR